MHHVCLVDGRSCPVTDLLLTSVSLRKSRHVSNLTHSVVWFAEESVCYQAEEGQASFRYYEVKTDGGAVAASRFRSREENVFVQDARKVK